MNLRAIDLNLLVVLQQLLLERHVSRAAEQLSMSQPAVSRALQRLREMFDDPLLVRTSHGYDLSARAVSLLPQLNQLLDGAEHLITGPDFDPTKSTRTVRFYGPEPEISWFLPPLFESMRKLAPCMMMDARSDPRDHFELLESGDVHFVFSPFQPSANASQLRMYKLASLDFAIMMSADNQLAKGTLTMKKFIAASHGVISLTGRGPSLLEQDMIARGHLSHGEHLRVPLILSSFTSVASFCERSDVLFHLPRRFAEELSQGRNIVVRDILPGMKVKHVNVYLYWHERNHKDAMCTWIRDQLKTVLKHD